MQIFWLLIIVYQFTSSCGFCSPSVHLQRHVNIGPLVERKNTGRKLSGNWRQYRTSSLLAEHHPTLSVALDQPLYDPMTISEGISGAHLKGLVSIALTSIIFRTFSMKAAKEMDGFDDFNDDDSVGFHKEGVGFHQEDNINRLNNVPYFGLKTLISSTLQLVSKAANKLHLLCSGIRCLPLDQWNACSLISKEHLANNKYSRYSFALPTHNQRICLPVVGEKLVLTALNQHDQVCTLFTHPSRRSAHGTFDVIVDNYDEDDQGAAMSELLYEMPLGTEVAVCGDGGGLSFASKLGDKNGNLVTRGVKTLHCFVNGKGILAAIPFLSQFLDIAKRLSDLKHVNMIWVNKKEDEFILDQEVESLWEKYNHVLDVSSILDKFNSVSSFARNKALIEVFPKQYSLGTMAVVAGPSSFVNTVTSLLADRGFPPAAITVIE